MLSTRAPMAIAAILCGGSLHLAVAEFSALAAIKEAYTTNAICRKNNCINPIFPGMEDMHRLQQAKWVTSTLQKTAPSMGFCRNAIAYDPALPIPDGTGSSVKALVQRQDNAASTMFYYHLAGLGYEAWDYQQPEFANDCVKAIWRMTCFTYFPRAQVGAQEGSVSNYIRPCQSSCMNYISTCAVECCDESVKCVFSHTKALSATQVVTTKGYEPHDGPSSLCTGGARRSAAPLGLVALLVALFSIDGSAVRSLFGRKAFFIAALAIVALSLQGCDYDVPVHRVGNWRANPDYLMAHEYIPPGGSPKFASLNSCSLQRLSATLQCSGRGVCKLWDSNNVANQLAFCECDRDWADPECRTARKSQAKAYMLSMFFGMFGADQFYLGHTLAGLAKLFTLGGFGIWWVADIVRIGSAPVYSNTYRTAADLPHWAYVLSTVMFAIFLGFVLAYKVTTSFRARKRREAMMLQTNEENRQFEAKPFGDAYKVKKDGGNGMNPVMSGYGAF